MAGFKDIFNYIFYFTSNIRTILMFIFFINFFVEKKFHWNFFWVIADEFIYGYLCKQLVVATGDELNIILVKIQIKK